MSRLGFVLKSSTCLPVEQLIKSLSEVLLKVVMFPASECRGSSYPAYNILPHTEHKDVMGGCYMGYGKSITKWHTYFSHTVTG